MKHETIYNLYRVCCKKNWFSSGTNEQYMKLFDMNCNKASIHELSIMIWMATDHGWTLKSVEDFLKQYQGLVDESNRIYGLAEEMQEKALWTDDTDERRALIEEAENLMDKGCELIEAARDLLD